MLTLEGRKKTVYKAFGLTITSDYYFPQLSNGTTKDALTDVVIVQADLNSLWTELKNGNNPFVFHEDFVMFHVPRVAIYLIKGGTEIFVSPIGKVKEENVRFFILGTCMGILLLQRKILPLHGSAVVIDGKAYAVVGDSGAGKSTLAAAFIEKGYPLLSDDILPITMSKEHIPIVQPSYPQQKLWLNSIKAFGIEQGEGRPIFNRPDKFTVPVRSMFMEKSVPLAGVFELSKAETNSVQLSPVYTRLHVLQLFLQHTYRSFLMKHLQRSKWHFEYTTRIASHINVYQIYRPMERFTVYELVNRILEQVRQE
ncbi:aldolase [Virgibacillus sp. W0430]|uniref:aldolase n=1 Tax=Virgibacillus sp. W0430 TaxID=3391580 RepID=UPI003F47ECB7